MGRKRPFIDEYGAEIGAGGPLLGVPRGGQGRHAEGVHRIGLARGLAIVEGGVQGEGRRARESPERLRTDE